jgi:hypothetical protein
MEGSWCGGEWRVEKCENLLKKRSSNFFAREFWRVVCVLKKKVAKYSGQSRPKLISPYALGGGRKIHKFALGAEMASYGPALISTKKAYTLTGPYKELVEQVATASLNFF